MTEYDAEKNPADPIAPYVIEAFQIKAPIITGDVETPKTDSWGDVLRGVNSSLKSIVAEFFKFFPEAIHACRRFVKGVSTMPDAVAKRIEPAHRAADRAEENEQLRFQEGLLNVLPEQAGEQLRQLLAEFDSRGLAIQLIERNGKNAIVIGYQESAIEIASLVTESLRQDEPSSKIPTEKGRSQAVENKQLPPNWREIEP